MTAPDAPFSRAARLPRALQRPGLTTAAGLTGRRLRDLRRWLRALAAGHLPPPDADFGDPQALAPMRAIAQDLDLAASCRGQPMLAESLLVTLLWHLDHLIDLQPRLSRSEAIDQAAAELRDLWLRERGDWGEALALLQDLGDFGDLSWDRLRGRLRSREWQQARRIQSHLVRLPELVALIRQLGRAERRGPVSTPLPPPDESAPRQAGWCWVETRLRGMPGELNGITLSGRVDGMLASEAVMLRHPVLKKLWRARHAEARLLAYDSHSLLRDLRPDPVAPPRAGQARPRPEPLQRGPIVLCLDTSGSMRGAPETLAKAVALLALRTAHAEGRRCLLIAFGGAEEVVEHELSLTPQGLDALLALMGQSFDGGTDLQAPVERALARVQRHGWQRADLLVVSDGEFGCMPATLAQLDDAREQLGLRVQGVLVGDRETMGLLELCDHIFWVRDWRAHGEHPPAAGFSPVHSKSLTALYFPNALSARAARSHAQDGSR